MWQATFSLETLMNYPRVEGKPIRFPSLPRPWKRKAASTVSRASSPPPIVPALPVAPKVESPAPDTATREMPTPMPLPAGPDIFVNLTMLPSTEIIPTVSPVPDLLAATWDEVKDGPKGVSVDRSLDVLGDAMTAAQSNAAPFTPLITAAASAVGQTEIGQAVKEGIDRFFDGMPVLMNALDELKALHPFVGVVVLAFTAVYTLEQKRRDNEKKIIALYVEMKEMMGVLLLLRDVQNDKLVAPDGRSIEDRLKTLVERTADDIKLCSNVCDTYAKKKLLAKVFLGPVWDDKLLSWVTLFSKRRQEFEFELSIHTSQGVDKANVKLDVIGDATRALDEKMDVLKAMFEQLVSPEQKQLEATVAANGARPQAHLAPEGHRAPRAMASDANANADDLRMDIFEDPDAAVEKNQVVYFRKFEAQKRQIVDELTFVVKRESDRVIQEMKGGPHDRIRDRTIYDIWTEMGWRGNVKARHFVLALRDHYLEKLAAETEGVPGMSTASANSSRNPDAWAIKFIDVTRLQPILEAFDDDASGFITISEMNRFTGSRPADWSLPHWVAFWAVGYRASIIDYANKIEELLAKMEGIRAEVLPPNRLAVDDYFRFVWRSVHTLTAAVTPLQPESGPSNWDRFKSHLEAEEARLNTNLKAVDYTIDGTDTLTLIAGVGRIEKTVFPLIYLLLKRHYEVMRAMRTKVLDSRELWYSVETILYVKDAIQYRVNDLANIFTQQKHDPKKQFQNFAYGIFKYFHTTNDLWSEEYVRKLDSRVIPYDDAKEDKDVKLEEILKYEHKDELALDEWVYDGHSIDDTPSYGDVEPSLKDILGHWHGYFYEEDGTLETSGTDSMMTFVLEPANGEHELKANAWSNRGRYTITGSWSKGENDVIEVKLKMSFPNVFWSTIFFSGRFDAERAVLTGVWGLSAGAENSGGPMIFRRMPPRYLTVYPSIKELSDNKSRALWGFAIAAVRNDVRRERWSWSYFAQRRDDRKTVLSLVIRYCYFGKPTSDEESEWCCAAVQRLTSADACFYTSRIDHIRAYTWVHENARCDWCRGLIGGPRLLCLDCVIEGTKSHNTVDLCCAPACVAARITRRQDITAPHEPHHRLVKIRTTVLTRQHGRALTAAQNAFTKAEKFCKRIAEASQQAQDKDKKEQTVPDAEPALSPEDVPSDSPSKDDKPENHLDTPEDTKSGTEAASTPKDVPSETPPKDDNPANGPDTPEDAKSGAQGIEDTPQEQQETPQSAEQAQARDSDLPSCGKCHGPLSFPCWYCVKCEDDLFLCEACEGSDACPELMRSSGKHTEEHHLIRCQAPKNTDDKTFSTEQRLISLEDRLNNVHTRVETIEQLLRQLAEAVASLQRT
ncbi:hypothetical protein EDB83DRAFT_2548774 [Lactarius deliciosus]|nr:hypothetical protein EDB83DRAFT_2548774 [Lactarius deliciosus]